MAKTLEEFVREWQCSKAHKPTEKELSDILNGQAQPITILPNGEIAVLGEDLEFAKAVYAFTEKGVRVKVLQEIRDISIGTCRCPSCIGCNEWHKIIDQKIEEAGK